MPSHLDDHTFGGFQRLLQSAVGVRIHRAARAEFERHLQCRLGALQLDTAAQYLAVLREGGSAEELQGLVDAVVPSAPHPLEGEPAPLGFLRDWLAGRAEARVWCAACGGGDEVAAVGRLGQELGVALELLGTDVNTTLVARARQANPGARFACHNLLEPLEGFGTFDTVLLRHVLGEFDVATRSRVLEHVHAVLRRDGLLVLGESESLLQVPHRFRFLRPALYLRTAGIRSPA